MMASKPVATPIEQNHKLNKALGEKKKKLYKQLVGRLIYLAHDRPDIAYSVIVINQFMPDPREIHLQTTYRVLHYLKAHPRKGILFKKHHILLWKYTPMQILQGPIG